MLYNKNCFKIHRDYLNSQSSNHWFAHKGLKDILHIMQLKIRYYSMLGFRAPLAPGSSAPYICSKLSMSQNGKLLSIQARAILQPNLEPARSKSLH